MPQDMIVPITAKPAAIGWPATSAIAMTARLISSIEGTAHRQGSSSTCVMAWNITM